MWFDLIGEVTKVRTISVGRSIRELKRLRKFYGKGRWRKLKGLAIIRIPNGEVCKAEVHWYEAHGIGKKEFKIKRIIQSNL